MKLAVDNLIMSMPFVIMTALLTQLAWLRGWLKKWWKKPDNERSSRGYLLYVITSAILLSEAVDRADPDSSFLRYLMTLLVLFVIKAAIERRFARQSRD